MKKMRVHLGSLMERTKEGWVLECLPEDLRDLTSELRHFETVLGDASRTMKPLPDDLLKPWIPPKDEIEALKARVQAACKELDTMSER